MTKTKTKKYSFAATGAIMALTLILWQTAKTIAAALPALPTVTVANVRNLATETADDQLEITLHLDGCQPINELADDHQSDQMLTQPTEPLSADDGVNDKVDALKTLNVTTDNSNSTAKTPALGELVINEFMADPLSGENEWVEILNKTNLSFNLNDLYLEEGSGRKQFLVGEISPLGYLVIDTARLNNEGDVLRLRAAEVVLDEVIYGKWGDRLTTNAPLSGKGKSLIRLNNNQDTNQHNQDWHITLTPTPGATNLLTTEDNKAVNQPTADDSVAADSQITTVETAEAEEVSEGTIASEAEKIATPPTVNVLNFTAADLLINEFIPDPTGSDDYEWLELFNASLETINLNGWQIDDEPGGSKPYVFPADERLAPGEYLLLTKSVSKLALNNDSDQVRILTPLGEVLTAVSYDQVITGASYSRDVYDNYHWTKTPTPGAKNSFTPLSPSAPDQPTADPDTGENVNDAANENQTKTITNLTAVRDLSSGTVVTVRGIVSAEPGILGNQLMYLSGSGIQLFLYSAAWPQLSEGDLIEVTGELSQARGESRLKIQNANDITFLKSAEVPSPHAITLSEVAEEREGYLVKINGAISQKKSDRLWLADDENEVEVVIKSEANISLTEFAVGDTLKVTGIVSQYDESYRLLPRRQSDLEKIAAEKNELTDVQFTGFTNRPDILGGRFPQDLWRYVSFATTAVTLTLIGMMIRQKITKNKNISV